MNSLRLRFPGGKLKCFTMSYDDGVEQDVRLISIMRRRAVKGTFNLNSGLFAADGTVYPAGQVHRRMTLAACKKAYAGSDIEIAVHGYTHAFWDALPGARRVMDIARDREELETAFGRIVRGAAYPYGAYDEDTISALAASGIAYCRTVNSTHCFALPKRFLELNPTCHHNDEKLFELGERFLGETRQREALLFYLWGHAYEFEGNDNWQRIEDFLALIGGQADVWYATNIELYDYVSAFKQLQTTLLGDIAHNPTATELWFAKDERIFRIGAGETLEIK